MKNKLITIKIDPAEKERIDSAFKISDATISEIARNALGRYATRILKKDADRREQAQGREGA